MTTSNTKCRSKNPSACRYHGSIEVHQQTHREEQGVYYVLLKEHLTGSGNVTETKIAEAANRVTEAQASVDAHDENFSNITATITELKKLTSETDYRFDDPYDQAGKELRELQERYQQARIVREKRNRSETDGELGWKSTYVAHIEKGSLISSGEKVVSVHPRPGLGSNKREVILEDAEGERYARIWGSHTKISVLTPAAQGNEPETVSVAEGEDPWAPKD